MLLVPWRVPQDFFFQGARGRDRSCVQFVKNEDNLRGTIWMYIITYLANG